MPVRPSPRTYTCPACGWFKTVAPRSDALMPGDYYDACPSCGHKPLESRPSNLAENVFENVSSKIKTLLG